MEAKDSLNKIDVFVIVKVFNANKLGYLSPLLTLAT